MSTTPRKTVFDLAAADREVADGDRPEPFAADLGPANVKADAEVDGEHEGNVLVVFIDPDELSWLEGSQITPDAPVSMLRSLLSAEDFKKLLNQKLKTRQMKALMKGFAEHYGWVDLGNLGG